MFLGKTETGGDIAVFSDVPLLTSGHHCMKKAKVRKQKGERLAAEISEVVTGKRRGGGSRLALGPAPMPFPTKI